jgi:ABC-2 type transport system ATP-binding protein
MLEASDLKKSFGPLAAVDGVSLSLLPGRILGLLGPNGAGKTTTVSMLAGILPPDGGRVLLSGKPLRGEDDPAKGRIGFVPQETALVEELSAEDNLLFFGSLFGMAGRPLREAAGRALAFAGLAERGRDRVSTFSGGMKRRLNLAASLLHDPPVLLLDEPTVGVDPQSRNAIFERILELRARGKAILYTTHYMEEAERLCDDLVILDHGRVVARGTLAELGALLSPPARLRVELAQCPPPTLAVDLAHLEGVRRVELEERSLVVTLGALSGDTPRLLTRLQFLGLPWTHVESERPDLEEIFLSLTGKGPRDP